MKPFSYAVWLVPCAEQRDELQKTIDSLATRFGTPSFEPHATLCSGVWKGSEKELIEQINQLQPKLPIELAANDIDWTDHWSTFFFLKLAGAEDLSKQAEKLIEDSHLPKVGPHLSLLYGTKNISMDRNAIRAALNVPPAITFDALALVCPETGKWHDFESWTIPYVTE